MENRARVSFSKINNRAWLNTNPAGRSDTLTRTVIYYCVARRLYRYVPSDVKIPRLGRTSKKKSVEIGFFFPRFLFLFNEKSRAYKNNAGELKTRVANDYEFFHLIYVSFIARIFFVTHDFSKRPNDKRETVHSPMYPTVRARVHILLYVAIRYYYYYYYYYRYYVTHEPVRNPDCLVRTRYNTA